MSGVSLRDVVEGDLEALFEHQREPEANQMAAFSARDRPAFMAHWTKLLANPEVITKAIVLDGALVGNLGCWSSEGERLLGYWIGKAWWGQGIATQALRLFLAGYAARPLTAHVAKHNPGSIRVLEKCGFLAIGEESVDDEHGHVVELIYRLR
jgi:RimJ/RimL family protein N-acetyltransferase